MNTEKLEKLKKSLDNKFIPDNMKDKIRVEIQKLESEIKTDDTITATEVKEEVKEIEKKVEKALEVADKKEEQAQAKAPAKTRTKRTTTSRTKKPKVEEKPTAKKKTFTAIAKEIRKAGESWEDAKLRARKMMTSQTTEIKKKTRTETDKLLAMVRRNKEYKKLAGTSNLSKDAQRRAMQRGKRVSTKGWKNQYGESEGGKVYYENRANRVDVGGFKSAYLETGGGVDESLDEIIERLSKEKGYPNVKLSRSEYEEVLRKAHKIKYGTKYANGGSITLTPETPLARDLGISYTGLVGETGAMSSGEMFMNGGFMNNVYAKGGELKGKFLAEIKVPYNYERVVKDEFEFTEFLSKKLTNNWFGNGYWGVTIVKPLFEKDYSQKIVVEIQIPVGVTQGGGLDKFDVEEFISKTLTKKWFGNGYWGVEIVNKYEQGGSTGLPEGTQQHFVNYYLGEGTAQGIYADGGSMNEKSTFKYYKVPNENLYAIQECDINGENCGVIRNKKSEAEAIKEVERLNKQGYSEYSYSDGGFMDGVYAKGGGVRRVGNREYSTGRNWTNDHKHVNKSEEHEVKYTRKKSFAGGGGVSDESPKIYVADLEAYNNGRLSGVWLDLMDYNDADELMGAIQDFLKTTGGEEYAIHDVENIPNSIYSEYMGQRDFEELYEMIDLAKDNDLPLEVVIQVVSQYGASAVDEFMGKYDSADDFAQQLVDDTGIESFIDFERYLIVSDTDRRLLAQEMADNYVDDIKEEGNGERLIEEANLDLDEYEEADEDRQEEMLDEAREILYNEYYDTWYDGLSDPYYFLVEEQGLYSAEDFANANFVQIDYEALAEALEYDYAFIYNDGDLYVFNIR